MLRPLFALLTVVALFALPSAALAQSAGDDQYSDPFGDTEEPSGGGGGQTDGDQPVDDSGSTTQQPTSSTPDPATSGAAETSSGSATASLPRTGYDVILLFAAAFPLLLGGLALRRVAS